MQYVIWILLVVFCLLPAVIAQGVLKHDQRVEREKGGGEA